MVGANNNGVFQNNFLLPKASPNTGGMIKTFYNSKQSTSGVGSTTGSSSGGMGGIPANIYHHSNNSSNSTKRAIQGMKMHIWGEKSAYPGLLWYFSVMTKITYNLNIRIANQSKWETTTNRESTHSHHSPYQNRRRISALVVNHASIVNKQNKHITKILFFELSMYLSDDPKT